MSAAAAERGWALITGASRGIGAAFAAALAPEYRLILSGRSVADLERIRAGCGRPPEEVVCLPADLNRDGAGELLRAVNERRLAVELLVNNAGLGSGGAFSGLRVERELEEVRVNVAALVALTHGCLAGMRERGRGAVIQVASTASFQPVPFLATYAATKAFVLHFSLALHEELREEGIHVMALCPGPTRTGFFETAGIPPRADGMQTPREVVALALRGLERRKPLVVCGGRNRAMVAAERLVPRAVLARLVGMAMRSWRLPEG